MMTAQSTSPFRVLSLATPLLLLLPTAAFGADDVEIGPEAMQSTPSEAEEKRPLPDFSAYASDVIVVMDEPLKPSRVTGSAHIVDEVQLERFEYDDIHRILKQVPGVYVREEDGFGLRPNIGLRGVNSNRSSKITLMEDGVLMAPAPYSAPAAYYFPLVTAMTGLEVYKGPGAVKFGPNTVGGAVNFLSRPIETGQHGALDLVVGQRGLGKAAGFLSYGGQRGGIQLDGARILTDGFKQIDGGGPTGFDKSEVRLKAQYHNDPYADIHQALELKLGYAQEKSYETYLGLTDADFEADAYRRYAATQLADMQWKRGQYELTHFLSVGGIFTLKTTAYRHDFHRVWAKMNGFRNGPSFESILSNPTAGAAAVYLAIIKGEEDSNSLDQALILGTNDRTYVSQGIQTRANWRHSFGRALSDLEVGLRYHYDHIERYHTEDGYMMTGGQLLSDGQETVLATENKGLAKALAVHVVEDWVRGPLHISAGLRGEDIRTQKINLLADENDPQVVDRVILPGGGVVYDFGEGYSALVGVHRGFSTVSPGQADAVAPELSVNYEGGLRLTRGPFFAEAIGFFNNYSNLTGECTFSSGCDQDLLDAQYNGGAVYVWGGEWVLDYHHDFDSHRLGFQGTYTYTGTQFQTGFESDDRFFGDVEPGDALPYVPMHQFSTTLYGNGDRFNYALGLSHVSAMREVPGQGELDPLLSTEAYTMVDISGGIALRPGLEIYGKVDNALGVQAIAGRRPYGARPVKPRWAQIGVKANF